jgi:hypothetical protein
MSHEEKEAIFAAYQAGRITCAQLLASAARSRIATLEATPDPDEETRRELANCKALLRRFEADRPLSRRPAAH